MLYTLSKSSYSVNELENLLRHSTTQDAIMLWQDGVLQAVKNPQFFANKPNVFLLENDIAARGLQKITQNSPLNVISLADFVKLSEDYFPQIAL